MTLRKKLTTFASDRTARRVRSPIKNGLTDYEKGTYH
jgi:hypothetical protein